MDFESLNEEMKAQNWLETDVLPDANLRVLTCCTCAKT